MRTDELDYNLPAELIAQHPAQRRSDARLLVYDRAQDKITDAVFSGIGEFLRAGDCLVLNDTMVIPARFFARKQSGGKLEGLFLRQSDPGMWQVMLKGSGKVKPGQQIVLVDGAGEDYCLAELVEKEPGRCLLAVLCPKSAEAVLEDIGFAPLPPYIKRNGAGRDSGDDRSRYQTVYASRPGAVAAPTAGLHFTDELINNLRAKGVMFANITLHVGAGTFKPVSEDELEKHDIHEEWYDISASSAELINSTKAGPGRVIAVGTTSVRALESAARDSRVSPVHEDTQLFITPGYKFQVVDAMITNFHLPRSTLLALVGAMAGLDNIKKAYRHAIEQKYRFYSYGDAMFIV